MTARRWTALLCSLFAAAAAATPGTASAQLISATATSTPERATFPTTRSAEFRLRLVTGADAPPPGMVRFLLPQFGHGRTGWTLRLGDPRLEGPGRLGAVQRRHIDPFGHPCLRGYSTPGSRVPLELPANSTSTLVVPATLASAPPWDDTSYRLGFEVAQDGTTPIRVRAPGPVRAGPRGVRVGIHLRARWHIPGSELVRAVKLGVPVRVFGGTLPRLRNRPITLLFSRSGTVRRRVRTDDLGRYSYRWTPGRTGDFSVRARFTPPAGGPLAADVSCVRLLQVVR